MTVGAVVQARMSSSRLPGKVLRPLAGRPLLSWLVEGLGHSEALDRIVVATSDDPGDDAVAAWAEAIGLPCYRGSLRDVAARLAAAAIFAELDVVVRLSGDSPLLLPAVVDGAVSVYGSEEVDVVTNVRPRSFPAGQSVEIVSAALLAEAAAEMRKNHHREHVMPWFYDDPDRYRIRNVSCSPDLSAVRMTVDDSDDLAVVDAVLAQLTSTPWRMSLADLAALVDSVRGLS